MSVQRWNFDHLRHERKRLGLSPRQQQKRRKAARRQVKPRVAVESDAVVEWPLPPLNDRPQSARECRRRLRQAAR